MRGPITSSHLKAPISALRPREPICLSHTSSVMDALRTMHANGVGCVLVVDDDVLVGIFTEKDVLSRVLPRRSEMMAASLGEVMTRDPECLRPSDSIAFALNMMSVGRYRHVPLVDDYCHPSGVVSVRDIFRYLAEVTRKGALVPA